MWQRVQTLYLILALGLCVAMFFGISGTAFLILVGVATALNFLALTTFKIRIFQMRTAIFAALILLGLQVWLLIAYFSTADKTIYNVMYVFPIVAAILDILAARGIFADEMLVRSSSRLRAAKRKH